MATLETQYKLFIEKNPDCSHWTYQQWLDWWSYSIKEAIEEGFEPKISDDFQIGPDGAYEHTEENN